MQILIVLYISKWSLQNVEYVVIYWHSPFYRSILGNVFINIFTRIHECFHSSQTRGDAVIQVLVCIETVNLFSVSQ